MTGERREVGNDAARNREAFRGACGAVRRRPGTITTGGVRRSRSAFTLLEVLVCLSIVALLMSLLLPIIGNISEQSRRVACQSNLRQIGTGVLMYAQSHNELLPPSIFLRAGATPQPQQMVVARVGEFATSAPSSWDGLGLLFSTELIPAAPVFYCPSHRGQNSFARYADRWAGAPGEVVANYHYRGQGPKGDERAPDGSPRMTRFLSEVDPAQASLIADGMRQRSDYNHKIGANFFRADLTVHWYNDSDLRIVSGLAADGQAATAGGVTFAWDAFDRSGGLPDPDR